MHTLGDIATMLGATIDGRWADRSVNGIAALADAGPGDLSFLSSEQYLDEFNRTRAAGVIVSRKVKLAGDPGAQATPVLVVPDAELATARVLELFAPPIPRPPAGVDPQAHVDPTATIGPGAAIGARAFVGARSRVGARSVIHSGTFVGPDVSVGDDCEFFPNVVIRERITIADRVILHAGAVIGSDGFGYRWDGTRHVKVAQIGTVLIESDVEIGSCTCIDRAKFGVTRIGHGTKIDNLVQIAHNCTLGPHCILAGSVALAGSVTLGAGVVLGGQAAVRDHVTIGDGAMVAGCTGVTDDVPPKTIVSGTPAIQHRQNLREIGAVHRLPELLSEFNKLKQEFEAFKQRAGGCS